MADTIKVTATNITSGPKVFNSIPARVLQPGEFTGESVDIAKGEVRSMLATGFFEIDGADAIDDDADDADAGNVQGAIDTAVANARQELANKVLVEINGLNEAHAEEVKNLTERAETAEKDKAEALEKLAAAQSAPAKPISLSGLDKAKLLAVATLEEVELGDVTKNDDIKAAIELAREEAAKK